MNRRRNVIILAAGLALIVIVGVLTAARPRGDAVTATVQTVAYTRFTTRLPETGTIQRPLTQTLPALVAGNVARVYVRPGEHVAAGRLLVALDNPQLVSAARGARDAYLAAAGRARSAAQTNAVLPAQNQSTVVQAQANLEAARFKYNQAIADQKAGAQSGLGYGFSSAQEQRVAANAKVANADTDLREAQRVYNANRDLYTNKAISKDALDQSAAKLEQAKIADNQARLQRESMLAQLDRQTSVLSDSVRAARDSVRQAEAALAAARANAAQNKAGDVEAAQADAAARLNDLRYAEDQVARLQIRAPFSGIVQTIASQPTDSLRQLQPGDAVTVGQSVVSVASDAGFIVRARVDEQDIAQIRPGQRARITGEDLGSSALDGHVAAIAAVAQKSDDPSNTSRQVITTVALDRSLPFLRDGMTVDVDIITSDRAHVLAIAADAIRRDPQNKPYVYVIGKPGNRTKKAYVTLGATNESQAIVTSGLKPGDVVVSDRSPAIVENIAVKAAPSPSPSPKASGAAA